METAISYNEEITRQEVIRQRGNINEIKNILIIFLAHFNREDYILLYSIS